MTPSRLACALLLSLLPLLANAAEQGTSGAVSSADASVVPLLDELGYKYEVDEDGDYKLVIALDDDRTQMVFIRSQVETYGQHRVREIWSPAYKSESAALPGPVANRLLESSNALKLGAWVKNGNFAVLVVKIDAGSGAQALDQALVAAVTSADEMEQELAGNPASDEY